MSEAVVFKPLSPETIKQFQAASTATITMQLMKRGLRQMAINLRPMNPNAARMVGPAFTLRYIPGREDLTPPPKPTDPSNAQREAVELAPAGAVVVVSSGGELRSGTFGDILAARMMVRGIAGVVSDGGMRDAPVLATMNLPVFAVCPTAPPSMTSLMPIDVQRPIGCGGVPVFPNDVIIADADGVVVVPRHIADEVARDSADQEHLEKFIALQVMKGKAIPGLYPPNDETKAAYKAWIAAGEPTN
ncbi:ribonuclease activity regulator RraA [Reyranella sp. CPCC 100927]|uniref:ribonuclease activity regulator RraA n=1 Tax=Reyranella sp. CPCC 100927 TaxID=2599616 RepID=UPI0011B46D58|nr:ribonuclease activity regulator RraA [Reyranella sp. CPCC 100927]TWT05086.1 ribonuclease activity regulator RraA [Reyranella sp. CPCC 100927]